MTGNKKIYKQPVYRILNTRSKLSLICGSDTGDDSGGKDPYARQNDMDDMDDY